MSELVVRDELMLDLSMFRYDADSKCYVAKLSTFIGLGHRLCQRLFDSASEYGFALATPTGKVLFVADGYQTRHGEVIGFSYKERLPDKGYCVRIVNDWFDETEINHGHRIPDQ